MHPICIEFEIAELLAKHPDSLVTLLKNPKQFVISLMMLGFDEETAVAMLGKAMETHRQHAQLN